MSKLDDKLRSLKKDIPKISSELDDRVLNAMVTTPQKPKFNWPKWGLIATAATPILAMSIILVVTTQNSTSPMISGGNESQFASATTPENTETAAAENSEVAPGDAVSAQKYSVLSSDSIAATGVESGTTVYTYRDLTHAGSSEELSVEIKKYSENYQEVLEQLRAEMPTNASHFNENTVAIVPFIFSSEEKDIKLIDVEKSNENKLYFTFKLDSPGPEGDNTDRYIKFYFVSLKRKQFDINSETELSIKIVNSRNNSDESAYYHK